MPIDINLRINEPYFKNIADKVRRARELAKENIEIAQEKLKNFLTRKEVRIAMGQKAQKF